MSTVVIRAASLAVPGNSNMGVAANRIGPMASDSSSSVCGLGSLAMVTGTSDTAGPTSTATAVAPSSASFAFGRLISTEVKPIRLWICSASLAGMRNVWPAAFLATRVRLPPEATWCSRHRVRAPAGSAGGKRC